MSKKPPKYIKQEVICCGKKLKWINCGHRAGEGCPDCLGAGGWYDECPKCEKQPDLSELTVIK